ncbi:hypothetical protein E4631_03335 [Hymenobacter sp. UV11]|uniref:hypothetical protein n=1 Tax=Hymenobacter sp. UV11 TaxID=1849735 RepID=UPI00105F5E08|nr:hypothetical protein [Hymenobacter sp. UV11]TDN38364.1 hypothetical protein A8B98_23680 [Hymenobacter sp. UV11]TFZ68039.1 hypothetical protein E4631_03335 [Hymenobacter sp. UV11]
MPDLPILRRLPGLPALLALLAVAGAVYYYFAGESATLPLQLVPHLAPVPFTLDSVAVGPARLPLPVSGFITTLTHDVGGPYTQPLAAGLWLSVLGLALAGWLAVVSMLRRPAFLAGTVPVVFLLAALNADGLGVFNPTRQYFLYLSLGVLGAAALGLQAFGERVGVGRRVVLFGALLGGLVALLLAKSQLPPAETALHLAAYATPAGAGLVAALVLWVGVENVRALLWFNTQAENPESRFGRLPFILSSLLYLGTLFLYWYNGDTLALGGGLHLDPLVLLLPAALTAGLGLRERAPSYAGWLPFVAARPLYWLLLAAAAAALGYALATDNTPLLTAARTFSVRALLLLGAAFLLYVLVNFGSLIQQRLRVYRVVFEPRRLPFYTVYILGVAALLLFELRNGWPLLDQVQAGQYNQFGDLARQQSEARPDDLPLALLAERYYAESGDVLARFNRSAQVGRAALYSFRNQRQNEINALRRALLRQPDEKISLQLNSLLTEPADFLDALEVLRQARRAAPRSFAVASDAAQLFTRSTLTDSVVFYLGKAERLRPGSYVGRTNQLGFLLSQGLVPAAQKMAKPWPATATEPGLLANKELLALLNSRVVTSPTPPASLDLDAAAFAQVYHAALLTARAAQRAACRRADTELARLAERPANEPYYEQLLFLQALLRHAAGQELAARQTLAPLTAGTSGTSGYYQYVLGLWQLQQEQYATAANQLALAAAHGARDARLPHAWALALAGQVDSAQAAYRRLAADTARAQGVARLGLALRAPNLLHSKPPTGLVGSSELAAAQQAEAAHSLPEATRRYQALVKLAPFNETAVLAAARFFAQQKATTDAYDALNKGLTENPTSLPLLQAYALAAADAGLADLGQSALTQLRPRLSPAGYANLLTQFAAHRAANAAAVAAFDQVPLPVR